MSRRAIGYPPPGAVVRVPEPIWVEALMEVRHYAALGADGSLGGSEALVFLGGIVSGAEVVVTSLYCLGHAPQGGTVVVAADQARWLVRALRAADEKLVGQVHSHRGLAGHSTGDDRHATSFHEGFVSIVVPRFGVGVTSLEECAVLEYCDGAFMEVDAADVARRVRIEPHVRRRASRPALPTPTTKDSAWSRFVRRLKSIARRLR